MSLIGLCSFHLKLNVTGMHNAEYRPDCYTNQAKVTGHHVCIQKLIWHEWALVQDFLKSEVGTKFPTNSAWLRGPCPDFS